MFHECRYAESTAIFNQLCDQNAGNGSLLIAAAKACSRAYDYPGVQHRFSQLESLENISCDHWLAMVQISRWIRREEWARRYFEKAITSVNPSAEASAEFALFMERSNDFDKANELIARGLRIDASSANCQLAKAKVLRRQKAYGAAEQWLNDLLQNSKARIQTQISACYELAQLYDSQGGYHHAMAALLKAKQLTQSAPEFSHLVKTAITAEQNHARVLQTIDAAYFKKASDWQPARKHRIALLGGHPRSGTTLLEQILDSNTNIISAEETSVFFDTVRSRFQLDLSGGEEVDARLQRWRADYFRHMQSLLDRSLSDMLLVDKNPCLTDGIPTLVRVFPECLYVIALRDPRDVVLSCFFMDIPINQVSVRYLSLKETAIRFVNSMAMWLACRQLLDKSKWLEVRYESLVKDPAGETPKIMQFLNVEYQQAQSHPELHARGRMVFSPTYADVTQPVHQRAVGRWKRYESWFGEASGVLESTMTALGY